MKSTDRKVNLAKSSDQRMVQTGNKHISRSNSKQPAFIWLFDRILSNQGPVVNGIKRSR